MMECKIIDILKQYGPLIGSELSTKINCDLLLLWKTCRLSKKILIQTAGNRYLRLDKNIKDFARLSPSILREFLSYSIIGICRSEKLMEDKAARLVRHIIEVSNFKYDVICRTVNDIMNSFNVKFSGKNKICFILAGDVAHNMAHDVPRPEKSTGKAASGSDIDLVVVADDDVPDDLINELDNRIHNEKYKLLKNPSLKQELDYVIKKIGTVSNQVKFDSFKSMVACKILNEGTLIYGDLHLFSSIKKLLMDSGVSLKLEKLKDLAIGKRKLAEECLLMENPETITDQTMLLFYSREETDEFE